jgi:hypothetical protein
MRLALIVMAAFLALGNLVFYRFDPRQPLWRRLLKVVVALVVTAIAFHYFRWTGVMVWFALLLAPLVYIHGIWLPRHGVNGWTAEPREKYHQLRGWPPPDR